jgi:hypothetical protein
LIEFSLLNLSPWPSLIGKTDQARSLPLLRLELRVVDKVHPPERKRMHEYIGKGNWDAIGKEGKIFLTGF